MKNIGVCEKLREELAPNKVNLPDEPQIAGALGRLPNFAIPVQTDLTGKQAGSNHCKKTCCCVDELNIENDQNIKLWT